MYKRTLKIASIIVASSLIYACGGDHEETTTEEGLVVTEEIISENNNQIEYVLPSPLQIAELFKRAGLTYIGDVTNSPENIDNYNTKYDQKLNYGIYSADMAYCIMNNQTQESINYLATLSKLSEKLWMTDIMGSIGLTDRLEANIGNEDSLAYIMADLQMQMDDYLDGNGMGHTGAIIFAGAWIETLYLGTKVNENKRNEKLISRLSEQAVILGSLIASIKQSDDNNEYIELITDLENLNKTFEGFNNDSEEDFILTDEAVSSLGDQIKILRAKIVGE